jgi:hypothetical protein
MKISFAPFSLAAARAVVVICSVALLSAEAANAVGSPPQLPSGKVHLKVYRYNHKPASSALLRTVVGTKQLPDIRLDASGTALLVNLPLETRIHLATFDTDGETGHALVVLHRDHPEIDFTFQEKR